MCEKNVDFENMQTIKISIKIFEFIFSAYFKMFNSIRSNIIRTKPLKNVFATLMVPIHNGIQ